MTRLCISSLLFSFTVACTFGGDGTDPDRNESDEPGVDERLDQLGIICESTLTVSGTFEETQAQPAEISGCWGAGIWTVSWSLDFEGCTPQPAFAETYTYEVTRGGDDNDEWDVIWRENPDDLRVNLKITGAGSNCQGSFEHFGDGGDDRIVISMHPFLENSGELTGSGAWALHSDDPF